jgi:hypothetical protein
MHLLLFFSFFHTLLLLFRNEIEKMLSLFLCNQHALCAPLNVLRRYQPPFAAWKDPTPHRLALTAVFTAALRDSALDKLDYPLSRIHNLSPFELCVISPNNTRMGQQCACVRFFLLGLSICRIFLLFVSGRGHRFATILPSTLDVDSMEPLPPFLSTASAYDQVCVWGGCLCGLPGFLVTLLIPTIST